VLVTLAGMLLVELSQAAQVSLAELELAAPSQTAHVAESVEEASTGVLLD